jgi:3-oxoacyl-(acyl-carrier-protein) synthase
VTAPSPDGDGGYRSMHAALKRANLSPSDIDYVNAHGTSTPLGDEIELGAVKRLFGNAAYNISMSSTKSSIGHLLGAAGSVEIIFSILPLRDQRARRTSISTIIAGRDMIRACRPSSGRAGVFELLWLAAQRGPVFAMPHHRTG